MELIKTIGILCLVTQALFVSCQNENSNIIASKGNLQLTETHFKKHVTDIENGLDQLSQDEIRSEKNILKEMFMESPEEILASLSETQDSIVNPAISSVPQNQRISGGNLKVRSLLGTDIGQMQFDSQAASTFRQYIANSLFTSSSNSRGTGYNSSNYSESTATIQFCPDGTFVQALSGYMNISVEGMSATTDNSPNYMPGYWEVASLPNNMLVILFYSTHPSMLEDSPNGFLPFPVAKYTKDFVLMPNGDGYSRTAHQYCR